MDMLKCLLVEDSLFIREIYKLCLKDESRIQIIAETSNGQEAIQMVKKLQPDIVILDLVVPEKNGFDVLSECAQTSSKFVVISSLADEEYKIKAKNLGAIAYLEKPFKKLDFLKTIEMAMTEDKGVING